MADLHFLANPARFRRFSQRVLPSLAFATVLAIGVGLWLALYLAPPGWAWMLGGFAAFRLFDIWKPWPVRWADRAVHGGFGTMLDDLLAGGYAWLALHLAEAIISRL